MTRLEELAARDAPVDIHRKCGVGIQKGDDFRAGVNDNITYGIHVDNWGNKIEVYGDEKLRDRILALLQGEDWNVSNVGDDNV